VEDKSREGVGWAIATLLLGIGAVLSPDPLPKLLFSVGAIGTGTKTVNCFGASANAAYRQVAARQDYRQLPAHVYSVSQAKLVMG